MVMARVRRLFASSGGNYAYVTARVKALKTHLLTEDTFPKLIVRDVHEIARSLQEGQYKEAIDELGADHAGAVLIERATRLNMGRQFDRILSWCRGEPNHVLGHYLERFTVYNVKTLLRGAQAGASREETEAAIIPAGLASMETWSGALGAQSLAECIELLGETRYGRIVAEMKEQPLPRIENALDLAYYKHLLEAVPPSSRANQAFLRFVKREIDVTNLKLVLRAKHAGVDDHEVVPGGREINAERARRLMAAQWSEVAPILDETDVGQAIKAELTEYQETRDLTKLVTALDQYLLAGADDFGHLYPLSILPIVDYVLHKVREVDRIRIIAFGKQQDLPREEIEALVGA